MLYPICCCSEEITELSNKLFSTLKKELDLSFKLNKQNELFAKFCGFPSYNHAKPVLKKLPSSPENHLDFNELVSKGLESGLSYRDIGDHLISFIENNLSCSGVNSQKKDSIRERFLPSPKTHDKWLTQSLDRLTRHNESHRSVETYDLLDHHKQNLLTPRGLRHTIIDSDLERLGASPIYRSDNKTVSLVKSPLDISRARRDDDIKNIFILDNITGMGFSPVHEIVRPSILNASCKKHVFVLPRVLIEQYKKEINKFLKDTSVNTEFDLNGEPITEFPRGISLISEHKFSKLDLDGADLRSTSVSYDCYPSRHGIVTALVTAINTRINKFPKAIIYIKEKDSLLAHRDSHLNFMDFYLKQSRPKAANMLLAWVFETLNKE